MTKSAPVNDSRWSVVLLTRSELPSLSISFSARDRMTPSRPSSMSMRDTCAPTRTGDCMSRRISSGTKLLEPPPTMVTLTGIR